eukprot:4841046-Pyramimonas_sp.AAC.1
MLAPGDGSPDYRLGDAFVGRVGGLTRAGAYLVEACVGPAGGVECSPQGSVQVGAEPAATGESCANHGKDALNC